MIRVVIYLVVVLDLAYEIRKAFSILGFAHQHIEVGVGFHHIPNPTY